MSLFLCPKIILKIFSSYMLILQIYIKISKISLEYLFCENGISALLLLQRRGKITIKLPKIHYSSYQITLQFIKWGIMAGEEVWQYMSITVFIFNTKKQSINSNDIESVCIAIIRKNIKNIIELLEVTHMNF